MISGSEVLKILKDTDPILMAVLGAALLGVCAWTMTIYMSTQVRQKQRGVGHRKVKPGQPIAPHITQSHLAALVDALRADNREALGQDLVRLIERHRNKRFRTFVIVTRGNVSPVTFLFLYQALRARNRLTAEVQEFQISLRDAHELLKACNTESARI
jgi:hypothetical protein